METKGKNQESKRKLYLSEFSYFDGEYEIVFNIIDVDFDRKQITVAISRSSPPCFKLSCVLFNATPETGTVLSVTLTVQEAFFPEPSAAVTLIFAVPTETARITPFLFTVATLLSLLS